jgi:FMN phosphatase YigB (HAD superfamily)
VAIVGARIAVSIALSGARPYPRAMPLAWVLFDWGGTLMSEDGPLDTPMELWPEVRAIDGAAEMLETLARRHRIAVATNAAGSDGAAIRKALGRVALDLHVSEIFCYRDLGLKKSDARFWDVVVARLGVPRGQLLMVGDDLDNDVLAPRRAGIASVWFDSTRAKGPAGMMVPTIARLDELPQLIASQFA